MIQEEALARFSRSHAVAAGRFELADAIDAARPARSLRKDLVLTAPPTPPSTVHRSRPQAAFLAHLLAVALRAPQTQEKRRAAPQDAISSYTATGRASPARPGRALRRAI